MLSYLNKVAMVGPFLINKLIALVFLTSFSMVIFSSLITSFNTIFFSKDLNWLMEKPIPLRQIFVLKAVNTSFYASWMVLVALVPFLTALGQVKNMPISFYGCTVLLLIPFLVLASLAGIIISLMMMRFFPSRSSRDILLLLSVFALTGLYVLFRLLQPERFVKPDGLEVVSQYLNYLNAPTAVWLPSWWVTGGVYSLISKNTSDFIFYLFLLLGSCFVFFAITVILSEIIFFHGWAEGQVHAKEKSRNNYTYFSKKPWLAIFTKDLKVFFRDAGQWSQLVLLSALVMVYLFSLYKLPLDTMYLQNLVSFFNVGLIGFILAAVALRFVFPSISLEGDSLWLIKSAPISDGEFLRAKLFFTGQPVVIMGVVLVLASNLLLKVDIQIFWISLAAVLVMAAGLAALAMGFGAMFPRFDLTNIAQIESSGGGLFYIITAFFYIAVSMSFWALPVKRFYEQKFNPAAHFNYGYFWWLFIGLLVINLLAVALPIWLAKKSLEKLEV
jgi:ABC-2 type transport system permease protein